MRLLVGAVMCWFSLCILHALSEPFPHNGDPEAGHIGRPLRHKRALTFPYFGTSNILLIFGLGTPLQLDRESVIVGAFTKILYALPTNATDYTQPGVRYSRAAKNSRWSIYKALQRLVELYGFGGKSCVLRAICEAAFAPFNIDHGLFGQLVQAILSPSSTDEMLDEYDDQEYHAAEAAGKIDGRNCHALYTECRRSVLDVFSSAYP